MPVTASLWGERWGLWGNVTSKSDVQDGETLYGFDESTITRIWKNQHPSNCSNAKFLISGDWEQGFGSEMHVYGVGLALALNMNRVFILFPNQMDSGLTDKMHSANRHQVDNEFCRSQGKENLECYYEPLTSCKITDAVPDGSLQRLRELGLGDQYPEALLQTPHRPEKALIVRYDSLGSDLVPHAFQQVAHCSPVAPKKLRYWWRSVSAAYQFRPNAAARAFIAQHRADPTMAFDHERERCVSVYVRRGDKDLEMKLEQNDTMFFEAARVLWDRLPGASTHGSSPPCSSAPRTPQ